MCHLRFSWPLIVALASTAPVKAADWYTGEASARAANDWIVAVDSSVNVTNNGSRTAVVVGTAALRETLSSSGPRIRVEALGGEFPFISASGSTTSQRIALSVLGGYEWVTPGTSVSGFIGAQVRRDDFILRLPDAPASGTSVGFAGAFNLYTRPTTDTIAHVFASYASVRNSYFARARSGWAFGEGYIGPEIGALGDDTFSQLRIGAHASGWKIADLQFGVSAGFVQNARGTGGVYGAIDVRAGF